MTIQSATERQTQRIAASVAGVPWTEPVARASSVRPQIEVVDHVLPDPDAYRARVLAQAFGSVSPAPGTVFHGIAEPPDDTLVQFLARWRPHLRPTLSVIRQSPLGQVEPNYLHTDEDMGQWTAVLYLTPRPALGDGTVFWQHVETGAYASTAQTLEEKLDEGRTWTDRDQWAVWRAVPALFNRLVWWEARAFHSRALFENYGTMGTDARLIQMVFGDFQET